VPLSAAATVAQPPPTPGSPTPVDAGPADAGSTATPRRDSDALAELRSGAEPLAMVMSRLIRLWTPDLQLPAGQNVCQALSRARLECFRSSGAWADLEQIDRPAILTLNLGAGDPLYVLLTGIDGNEALLEGAQGTQRFRLDQLDSLWTGEYLLLWQHMIEPLAIGPQVRGSAVLWLRRQLALANGQSLAAHASERYDTPLANQVRKFQSTHGLEADGYVGIRTLIALAAVSPSPGTPTLAPPVAPATATPAPAASSAGVQP
jgi:general secretion pathway protein A